MLDELGPRAVGVRVRFDQVSAPVQAWISDRFGPAEPLREHVGGMSPGCATTLRLESGGTVFVKAVRNDLNEGSVALYRQELRTLRSLPRAIYRPALLDAFDDGQWVAIALEAFDGGAPMLDNDADFAAALEVVSAQSQELTPPPEGLNVGPMADSVRRWAGRWDEIQARPELYLPPWARDRLDELAARVARLPEQLEPTTLCHLDIRDDNLLIGPAGDMAVIDWGMAGCGPVWADLAMLAWQRSDPKDAEEHLRRLIPPEAQETVTDLIVTIAGSQSWNSRQPARQNLPTMGEFCQQDTRRLFRLAAHRLGAPVP